MDGTGASLQGGRWNSPGVGPIYTAETYSAAFLELIVRFGRVAIPAAYHYCAIEIPDEVTVQDSHFPLDNLEHESLTRRAGNTWWKELQTAVLRVPSAVTRVDSNYLLNPKHPQFALVRPSAAKRVWVDPRMVAAAQGARPSGR